jgi:Fic family protein
MKYASKGHIAIMFRKTGKYTSTVFGDETVKAFIPYKLPPRNPSLKIEGKLAELHNQALLAISRLEIAGAMVPSTNWFLYGFVRKEAVISSQIEGTQATLKDVIAFEATHQASHPADVEEICNYVEALTYSRKELAKPNGLPLCTRLLCEVHNRLMNGVRGSEKQPGTIRTSQNWIGGSRPGTAKFVPPPPNKVPELLSSLEQWIHSNNPLPPLVKAGMAHAQFETIHPFLDGNGRIGRLLITLLIEHWGLLSSPLLYLSLAFKKNRQDYYRHLMEIRTKGDWEGWIRFFLKCVHQSAQNGVVTAQRLFEINSTDYKKIIDHKGITIFAVRLFNILPEHPMITLPSVMKLLDTTKPTASKAIDILCKTGVLHEITGKRRDRVYAYKSYLNTLAEDTAVPEEWQTNIFKTT